jgi:head-tail adaptor
MVLSEFVKIVDGYPTIEMGRLRHVITIMSFGPGSPPAYDDGGLVSTWTPFAQGVRAAMNPVRGTDVVRGGQTTSMVFIPVAIWFIPGITGGMRLATEYGDTFVVQSVANVLQMNKILVLNCLALGDEASS